MSKTFLINTVHRGRLIQILLLSLFAAGILSARLPFTEIVKIIGVLFCLPLILFLSIRFSQQPSRVTMTAHRLCIEKGKRNYEMRVETIDHIRNHIRSGGNLLAIYRKGQNQPLRFWRNKLFQSADDYETLIQEIKRLEIPYFVG